MLRSSLKNPDAHLHIYGKHVSRKGRKMGHVTFVGDNPRELLTKARTLASRITL
jgi:5-(carboxyamino)imidazole ribonucleotide synthase